MFFLKKRRLASRLAQAFPEAFEADVRAVCNALASTKSAAWNGVLYSAETSEWRLCCGERVKLPYRIYVSDRLCHSAKLSAWQMLIYHCIFSRSHDGYTRQKHVAALLTSPLLEWMMPYVVKITGEYVKEILICVYEGLQGKDTTALRTFCAKNLTCIRLEHCHMISYWNEYHRHGCYKYKNYIGKKLYAECFGYRKTGQKAIRL